MKSESLATIAPAVEPLPSTGERFIPGLGGSIELEHLHRYLFARQVCADRTVLDIACGEGYGSSMLAQTARRVVGVDIAAEAITHARKHYRGPNLRFEVGSCAAIPLEDASVDVVVSFETIEHHDQHVEMMREIRRVLRPGGLLVMSSPERFEYSERPRSHNEFHVHELYRDEFIALVREHFAHADIYDQKVIFGSALLPEEVSSPVISAHADAPYERTHGLVRPPYLLAVASDQPVPPLAGGVFEQELASTSEWKWWIDTLADRDSRIREMSKIVDEQRGRIEHLDRISLDLPTAHARADELTAECERLRDAKGKLDAELTTLQARLGDAAIALETQRREAETTLRERVAEWEAARTALDRDVTAQQARVAEASEREVAWRAAIATERENRELQHARLEASHAAVQDELREALATRDRRIAADAEALAKLAGQAVELQEVHQYVAKLHWVLSTTQDALAEANGRVASSDAALATERAAREALYASTSWQITAPVRIVKEALRAGARFGRRVAKRGFGAMRITYRRLPIDARVKRAGKNTFYRTFGAVLGGTAARRDWLAFQQAQRGGTPASMPIADAERHAEHLEVAPLAPDTTSMAEAPAETPTFSTAGTLWVADGVAEWAELPVLRERIASAAAARTATLAPAPLALATVSDDDVDAVADRLVFAVTDAPTVTVLVPVYNRIALTLECLSSLASAQTAVSFEVLVADDASTDRTPEILDRIVGLKRHRNERNLHFLRNCNAALPEANGRYVVFLNNDVQVRDWWLDELVAAFDRHDRVGAVGPKIVYPSGYLQEAGCAFNVDMTVDMIGLHDDPAAPRFNYERRVDYCSGACLMVPTALVRELGGFDEAFAPAYCEDGDLCMRIRERGLFVYYVPQAVVVHHLSATTAADNLDGKRRLVGTNLATFASKWQDRVEDAAAVRTIAFYLPQFYPFPENDRWWGKGFTEWTNVTKAQPNFVGHYQPHLPADLGYYDLRVASVMEEQAKLARRYGLGGFCFYYYWFAGKRLLDLPVERLLETGKPDFPFCLCWANENWTRRWDGQETHVLVAQSHSDADDEAVIVDLMRFFRSPHYIRIDGRPLLVVYRVSLFPDFARTAAHWRQVCREQGIGEIYISMVESFEMVNAEFHPSRYGCDATVEFPPQGLAEAVPPSGPLMNDEFVGNCVDYRTLAARYCGRDTPAYTRFRGAMPGWDNTPRRQNNGYCIEHATPGAFQAWLEHAVDDARRQHFGDERIVFVNAWNEWAEGAHLEPDRRFGHTYLEALANAQDGAALLRARRYALDG